MFRLIKSISCSLNDSTDGQPNEKFGCTQSKKNKDNSHNTPISRSEIGVKIYATRFAALACAFVITVMTLALSSAAHAQSLYGSVTGNVTDQAGASVAGAKVQLINAGTGDTKDATTDDKGGYQFNDLIPGIYKITIAAGSFKTVIQDSIKVDATQQRRVDAQLEVAKVVNETVVVSADTVQLQTDRADVNVVQSARQVNDLPLTGSLGRNYQSLMELVPGSVLQGEQNSVAGNPQRSISFNVNGVSRLQNNTRIDGASVVYPWLPTNTAYVPPAESIQEVSIVTNSFNAEQGLAGGAVINVIIKSGTNDFHATGWFFDTNSGTAARNAFTSATAAVPVPKNILNQFGYTVAGPILKNKLFFFTDLERTTQRTASAVKTITIAPSVLRPTAAGVDFSSTGTIIFDPASNPNPALRTPFANDIVPFNRIDPAALTLIGLLPNTTGPGFTNNYTPIGAGFFNRNNIDSKVNYIATSRLSIFGRYSLSPADVVDPSQLGAAGGDAINGGQVGNAPSRIQVAGAGGVYTINDHMIVDVNIGYTRQRLGAENTDINTNFGLDTLKIPGTNGPDLLQGGIPSFQISNWANLGNANTGNPFLFRDNQYVATANFSWLRAAHSFRFGLDYQNQQLNHFQPQGGTFETVRGAFSFTGNATSLQGGNLANQFNSWADFLLGLPTRAGKVDQLRNPNSLRMKSYALYARDQWQATRNLTLSYGLRWERYPFPTKDTTGINRFDPTTGNVLTGCLSGIPCDTGAASGAGEFLPRLGVAYRMGREGSSTVLRAGFGMSSDTRPFIDFRNAFPVVNVWDMPTVFFNGAANTFIPVTTLRQGLINTSPVPDLTQGILKLPANAQTTTFPANPLRKYIELWNLTIERELPWKLTAQMAYVGTRAVGQMQFININASAPGTGTAGRPLFQLFGLTQDINEILPYKTSTYDALQAQLKRSWAGSTFGIVYTFSRAIDFADNDSNPNIQFFPDAQQNRGLAGYDRTHNFQMYGVIDLPFGKGQRFLDGKHVDWLVGGWQLNGVLQAQSGTPFSITQSAGGNLNAFGSGQVPDQVAPVVILGGIGANPYFSTSSFTAVNIPAGQQQRFGNVGRNTIRGPGFFNVDMGMFRSFSITERIKAQIPY